MRKSKRTEKKIKKVEGIKIRLFEEEGEEGEEGEKIETIMGDLRIRGFFVEVVDEIKGEKRHLEITVGPKRIEKLEKILMNHGCCRISPEM